MGDSKQNDGKPLTIFSSLGRPICYEFDWLELVVEKKEIEAVVQNLLKSKWEVYWYSSGYVWELDEEKVSLEKERKLEKLTTKTAKHLVEDLAYRNMEGNSLTIEIFGVDKAKGIDVFKSGAKRYRPKKEIPPYPEFNENNLVNIMGDFIFAERSDLDFFLLQPPDGSLSYLYSKGMAPREVQTVLSVIGVEVQTKVGSYKVGTYEELDHLMLESLFKIEGGNSKN
jgi:hypothetical protein